MSQWTLVQTTRDAMAAQINEESMKVKIANVDWTPFLQQGVLVDLHVGRYRAQASITLDDLGITPSTPEEQAALERTLALGRRYLLPKTILDKAQAIESNARQWLVRNSFKTFWGQFIHVSRYQQWRERQILLEQEYLNLAQEIEDQYAALVAEVRNDYVTIANEIFARTINKDQTLTNDDRLQWVDQCVRRQLRNLPSAAEIRASFVMNYNVRFIPPQAMVAQDRVDAERVVMEARERARISAEEAMKADLRISEIRQAAGGVKQFVEDVQSQIRGAIYDSVVAALEMLRDTKQDGAPRVNAKRINAMVRMVQDLTFWEDPELQQKVATLSDLCEVTAAKRDVKEIENILLDLGAESRLMLLQMNQREMRSGRSVGIPDDIEELTSTLNTQREMRASAMGINLLDDELPELTMEAPRRMGNIELSVEA